MNAKLSQWGYAVNGLGYGLVPSDNKLLSHYNDVIIGTMASQITSLTIVYSTVYSGKDQRKHQTSASLAFVRGIHRWPVDSPHKGPVTRKMFPFDDVIIWSNFDQGQRQHTTKTVLVEEQCMVWHGPRSKSVKLFELKQIARRNDLHIVSK